MEKVKESKYSPKIADSALKYCHSIKMDSKEIQMFMRGVNYVLESVSVDKDKLAKLENKYLYKISEYTSAPVSEIFSDSRKLSVSRARMLFCWFLMEEGISWPVLASRIGRDRTSINHYDLKRANIDYDPFMKKAYYDIKQQLDLSADKIEAGTKH